MPASAGIVRSGVSWSGHSGGCSKVFFSLLERWRTSFPCASTMSSVTSSFGLAGKVIVDHRALGRVLAHRTAAVHLVRIVEPHRGLRLVEDRGRGRALRRELAQRRDVVQDPERAAVGGDHEIVAVHHQVVNRRDGQVELQRLPVRSVVEGCVHAALRAGKQQALASGIFPHRAHVEVLRNAVHQQRPGLAEIRGLIDIGLLIVELVTVHRHVSRAGIVRRRVDDADHAPLRQRFRRHVGPGACRRHA